jgi:hypothetical protein
MNRYELTSKGESFIHNPQRNRDGRIGADYYHKLILIYLFVKNPKYIPHEFKEFVESLGVLKDKDLDPKNTNSYRVWKNYTDAAKQRLLRSLILNENQDGTFSIAANRIDSAFSKISNYINTSSAMQDNSKLLQDELLLAIHQKVNSAGSPVFTKQQLIDKGLDVSLPDLSKNQLMPEEILSSTLDELKNLQIIAPLSNNDYLLIDSPIDVDQSDLSDESIDVAITNRKLIIGNVPTSDEQVLARRRHGQSRLRILTLYNYNHCCALCDVNDDSLLIASHVVRWADDPIARGDLSNIICLCRFHDPLFEQGYICLTDDYQIETISSSSKTISTNLALITGFKHPIKFPPSLDYLRRHRQRKRQNAT